MEISESACSQELNPYGNFPKMVSPLSYSQHHHNSFFVLTTTSAGCYRRCLLVLHSTMNGQRHDSGDARTFFLSISFRVTH